MECFSTLTLPRDPSFFWKLSAISTLEPLALRSPPGLGRETPPRSKRAPMASAFPQYQPTLGPREGASDRQPKRVGYEHVLGESWPPQGVIPSPKTVRFFPHPRKRAQRAVARVVTVPPSIRDETSSRLAA